MNTTGKVNWQKFWNGYRNEEATTEDELLFQVGRTIDRKPISRDAYQLMIERTSQLLELQPEDLLLELCCGNGLVTFDLAERVRKINAVDFAEHLIAAAKKLKSRANIQYFCADSREAIEACREDNFYPTKILMNAALAYFDVPDLKALLAGLLQHNQGRDFLALFTDVPNQEWMRRFYDTPERFARFTENQKRAENDNDGLGKWWDPQELRELTKDLGLEVSIRSQPEMLSNYRMDVLISTNGINPAAA